ncbi:head-to-tail adaptor [Gordonia phage Clown]|uniref:Head-to-tail adaptor n=1 Tax=Gordonia phage Clown TaxID=2759393 RepID=A0A7L7SU44_9CAUD|nr:head-tail adaptor [Gordonia phage Clown]QOC56025.1 head-to-tail adaptor [Gordonia phage Clown]
MVQWPIVIPSPARSFWDAADDTDKDAVTAMASHILWALTGEVFGVRDETVRPCFTPQTRGSTYYGAADPTPAWWPGVGVGNPGASGACGCRSGCQHVTEVDVWVPGPIVAVTRVVVDGVEVPASAYRVRSRRWLRRVDGQAWPQNPDLGAAEDEAGSFIIEYQRGILVPPEGQFAAGVLAVDLLRGVQGGECSLPSGITSISRQGLSMEVDPRAFFAEGLTGIEAVDEWIMAVNPYKSRRRARLSSPDRPRVDR